MECLERSETIPVDFFFRFNKNTTEEQRDDGQKSMFCKLDYDEYDDIYGTDEDVESTIKVGQMIGRKNAPVKVLFECSHAYHRTKHRHHPDYRKPYEVELLCCSCHRKAHKRKTGKDFHKDRLEIDRLFDTYFYPEDPALITEADSDDMGGASQPDSRPENF